jgi:hypothetical protein
MKLLALMVLACVLPLQADILVNGNFADGHAHWKGDAEDINADGPDAIPDLSKSDSSAPSGVVIKLKKDKWTKIYQTFNVHDTKLYYSVTFKLSPDYKIASGRGEASYSKPDFTDVPIGWFSYWSMPESYWSLIVTTSGEGSDSETSKYLRPDPKKPSPQTITGKLNDLQNGAEALFLIVFPPGEGSITLTNISLSPNDPNAEP